MDMRRELGGGVAAELGPHQRDLPIRAIAQAIVGRAEELGLIWRLRPATVAAPGPGGQVRVTYDGDTEPLDAVSLIGKTVAGARVMGLITPPAGNHIVGWLADPMPSLANMDLLILSPTPQASARHLTFNHSYSIFVDNTGGGAAGTRWWLDMPDGSEVVIGPRAGGSFMTVLRLRTNATTASAANCFIDSGTQQIRRSTSSRKYKRNVRDANLDPARLLALRPVTFHDKEELDKEDRKGPGGEDRARRYLGLIAEEVHDAGLTEYVSYHGTTGEPDAVEYARLPVGLLALAQRQQAQIADLTKRLEKLEKKPDPVR